MSPKEESEFLLNDGIPFAKQMLATHGQFYPFGCVLAPDGQIKWAGASDGSDHPSPQRMLDLLIEGFQKGAQEGKYTAIAVFADVRITNPLTGQKTDAVQVGLEHRLGYCANAFLPYSRGSGALTFGKLFACPRDGLVYRPF